MDLNILSSLCTQACRSIATVYRGIAGTSRRADQSPGKVFAMQMLPHRGCVYTRRGEVDQSVVTRMWSPPVMDLFLIKLSLSGSALSLSGSGSLSSHQNPGKVFAI